MAPTPTFIVSHLATTVVNTTIPTLLIRNPEPHHHLSNDTSRSDATMSDHDRAIKLRNLTIGWSIGIISLCILILVSIYCVLGKRRCCLAPRERDPAAYDARRAGASSSIPTVADFDARTEAQKRDEVLWKSWEERDRKRREENERERVRKALEEAGCGGGAGGGGGGAGG